QGVGRYNSGGPGRERGRHDRRAGVPEVDRDAVNRPALSECVLLRAPNGSVPRSSPWMMLGFLRSAIAHRFQVVYQLGPQRRLFVRAPFVEAFARFEAELSAGDELSQIG